MGNVQGEIDRISGAKTPLGDYLTQNGISVASGDKIDTMASKLSTVTAKQDKITAKGILKGDGAGTITAATAGTDYAAASHTHSLAGIMGSAAKGNATTPVYWDGTNFKTITSYSGEANTAKYPHNMALASSRTKTSGYWNPFTWTTTISWTGFSGIFGLVDYESRTLMGIFSVSVRNNDSFSGSGEVKWLSSSGSSVPTISLTKVETANTSVVFRLYIDVTGTYRAYHLSRLLWGDNGATITTSTAIVTSKTGTALSSSNGPNKLTLNGKTYDGSAAVNAGVIGAAYGGSGKTTLKDSANAFMNALETGTSTPADNDYYISQYAGGGTTTTTYHRRPMSALWAYIKSKIPSWALAASKPSYTAAEVGAEASGAVSTHNTSTSAHSTLFANKVDKVSGKGLSTNDYTTAEKTKLSGIETGAQKNVQADWSATSGAAAILNKPTLPTVAQAQVTLTAAGWSGTTQTVTVSGVTADNMVIVTYAPGSRAAWTDADIYCSAQAANALVFTCSDTPTEDVTANVAIFG